MIKIEIECATGAEARQQLIDLLYNDAQTSVPVTITDSTEISSTSIEASLKDVVEAAATVTKSKRKAKEAALSVVPSDDPSDNVPEGGDMQDGPTIEQANERESETAQPKVNAVTAQMLQEKAVAEIRKGKKEEVVAVIKKFGGDSISQADKNPLKPEVYADVMDAFNKL